MIVQNIVFNRLGNSFSAMIEYERETIQIWDDVKFCNDVSYEIISVCLENDFKVYLKVGTKNAEVVFDKTGFSVKNFHFDVLEGFFIHKTENPEILFKFSLSEFQFIKTAKEGSSLKIFIPEKNFFKGIAEFLSNI